MNKNIVLSKARSAGFMDAAEGRRSNPYRCPRTANRYSNRLIFEAYEKGYAKGLEWLKDEGRAS